MDKLSTFELYKMDDVDHPCIRTAIHRWGWRLTDSGGQKLVQREGFTEPEGAWKNFQETCTALGSRLMVDDVRMSYYELLSVGDRRLACNYVSDQPDPTLWIERTG